MWRFAEVAGVARKTSRCSNMPKGRRLSRPPWRSWRAARTEASDDHMMQSSRRKGGKRRGAHGDGAGVVVHARGRRRRAGEEEEGDGHGVPADSVDDVVLGVDPGISGSWLQRSGGSRRRRSTFRNQGVLAMSMVATQTSFSSSCHGVLSGGGERRREREGKGEGDGGGGEGKELGFGRGRRCGRWLAL